MESDPFEQDPLSEPGPEWEAAIRAVQVRKVQVPSADEQRAKIRQILGILEQELEEPTKDQVEESERILQNIHFMIPDHTQFIASSFSLHYPAWHKLLKDSRRKSARTVLSWLKNGFRPRFVGTAGAKPAKRKVVVEMLRKVVPPEKINEFLTGKFPHRIEFKNHKSLYKKWKLTLEQTFKMVEAGVIGIWDIEG